MITDEMARQLLALPLTERVEMAQLLWESLDERNEGPASDVDLAAAEEATRRDEELSRGTIAGRTHEDVMAAARRAIQ